MRINRYIAASTNWSRRQADEIIKNNRVAVNGNLLNDLSYQVSASDIVSIDGEEITPQHFVYYAVNKPMGVISSTSDPHAEVLVTDLVPESPSVFPIGRLDIDTSGLIILTNDGDFAQKIQHPSYNHEKEYLVQTTKSISKSDIDKLLQGIELKEGLAKCDKVKLISNTEMSVVLHQGWNRQIRRMLAVLGFRKVDLHRVRVGKLNLGLLKSGQYKNIKPEDVI